MKKFLLRPLLFVVASLALIQCTNAQKKLLILGSSTSTCFFGPSSVENCYVTKLQRYYESSGAAFVLDNRAVAGDNVYQGMPTNYTPPPGRNSPRPFSNITDGMQGNPDVVLINYPSNGYDVYSVDEVMFCLRTIKQVVNAAGKPCYVTTTQPRNDPASYQTLEVRNKMVEIKNRVIAEFGAYAINFFDGLANPDNSLAQQYQVDGIHINDAGHQILYNRVLEKNIFGGNPVPPPPPPSAGNGLTYKYYEGDWNSLPDFNALQPVKSGSTSNIDMSPRNRGDHYAFLWQGSINIPTSGNYTFELVSDDGSKLYFNTAYNAGAPALVSNDGLHAATPVSNSTYINAGSYPFAVSFFEKDGGEQLQVYWSGPGFSRQLIPNEAFGSQPSTSGGLSYKYFEGDWNTLPDFNALQPVKTGSIGNVDVSPRNRTDHYGFVWQGNISIPSTGNYTFELVSDDGSKLYFNSGYNAGATALVNNDGLHPAISASASTFINAGTYPIAIAYFEKDGGESMQVYWSGPGIPRQQIPTAAFSAATTTGGLKYRYYEGDWNALPDFNALQPVKTGSIANADMSPRNRADNYGFVWEGFIKIPAAGNYNFETISDDGSRIYFNSTYNANANALVNNDGLHAPASAVSNIYIGTPGTYPIAITYFEKDGGESLQVYWAGPGFGRQLIPNEAFTSSASFSNTAAENIQSQVHSGALNAGLNKTINAFPNPFNKTLDIAYYNDAAGKNVNAGLYDLSGKLIHGEYFKNIPAGSNTLKMNLRDSKSMADGIYFLKIDVNGVPLKVLKLVKSKG